jgi:lipopolysaccharide/colanic/teichoic acid biosynthesis glycosyltransferase
MPYSYHLCAQQHNLSPSLNDPEFLGRFGNYVKNMDRVIISCPTDERINWTPILKASGVRGELVSEPLRELGVIALRNEPGFTTVVISSGPLGLRARIFKRFIDVVIGGSALFILSPLMVTIAIAIKINDGGPVFFKQQRVGRGNLLFGVFKFRSMTVGETDPFGLKSTSREDQRITKVGRFIRRTSLDELPQLLNVLRGEMSLVGPRPHALGSNVNDKRFWELDDRYWYRHALKPGITGLAQIKGFRGATEETADLTGRVSYDLAYIQKWTPLLDIVILFQTLNVVIHKNAY